MRSSSHSAGFLLAVCLGIAACTGAISGDSVGLSGKGVGGSGSSGNAAGSSGTGAGGTGSSGTAAGSGASPGSVLSDGGIACTPLPTIYRRLWRLSAEHWGAAVQTMLNLPTAPVLTARGGESSVAFFGDISLQVDGDMQFNMYELAQAAVNSIDSSVGTTIAPCASGASAAAQTQCAQTYIQSFAKKAYRRPLDSDEVPNLMEVYAQGAMQSYKTGVELMMEAVLISPSFVYRTELGAPSTPDSTGNYPNTTLTPYEVASQLGFTLLGTIPDDALMAAAADGSLGTTAGVQTQVQRLLAVPAAQANITNIMLGWFNVNQMYTKIKDTSLLSSLPAADQGNQSVIESDLGTSTQDWVNSVLWKGSGKVDDLLTSQTIYVNQRLAALYPGLTFNGQAPTDDQHFVEATFPASQGRSGMLTQPSWLWAQSDPSVMSIVKRGRAVHDNVVCADPLPPPIDLTTPTARNVIACKSPDGTMTLSACNTEEEQSNARISFMPCMTCHEQMDPYSRVLADFGPIGNYQPLTEVETEAGTDPTGGPEDTTVTFIAPAPLAPQTLTGAQAFAKALIATGAFDGCSVQQIASYAVGSQITTYDTCELQPIRTTIDGSVQSLLTQVLTANFMRARAGGTQ